MKSCAVRGGHIFDTYEITTDEVCAPCMESYFRPDGTLVIADYSDVMEWLGPRSDSDLWAEYMDNWVAEWFGNERTLKERLKEISTNLKG